MPELDRKRRSGVSARDEERGGTDAEEVAPLHGRGLPVAIEPSLSLGTPDIAEFGLRYVAASPRDGRAAAGRGTAPLSIIKRTGDKIAGATEEDHADHSTRRGSSMV